MMWNQYKDFSPEFLERHHDLVLFDVYHQIKAFLLFPPNCSCKPCFCEDQRIKIVISLNTDLYNQALLNEEDSEILYAMKVLLRIPDDHWFRENQAELYPLRLFEQEYQKREESYHFKMVDRLVWALLRLAKTYELSIFRERRASLNEAIERILGSNPLKTNIVKLKNEDYLGGEKAYSARFNEYKSVCHFISAIEYMNKERGQRKKLTLGLKTPDQIKRFLGLSLWFRKELLYLENPNVKERSFFTEKTLQPLPSWVQNEETHILIEPYQDKLEAIEASAILMNPSKMKQ